MESTVQTEPYGGEGGTKFEPIIITDNMSIGLRAGSRVDQIRLGRNELGHNGGKDKGSIQLRNDEYIKRVEVRAGREVDYVKFTTNLDRTLEGGGSGGQEQKLLENIRVIAIGGRAGDRVDKLKIKYISNYEPSIVVKGEESASFILSFTAPFQKFTSYSDTKLNTLHSYEKLSEHILEQKYKASVEGEYFAKMASSLEINLKSTDLNKSIEEVKNETKNGETKTKTIEEGHVGVLLVHGTLMRSPDDEYWLYAKGAPQYSIIEATEIKGMLNTYDLTGLLYTQMQNLTDYKINKNSFVYYQR